MSYADGLLAPSERIVRRGRQHWFVLVWRARWAILAVVVGTLLLWIRANVSGDTPILDVLGYLTLALFVFGIAVIARGALQFRGEEYVITSRRVIHAEGVVNKRATDASLERINDAVLTESMFGRIFGFGNLDVVTASGIGARAAADAARRQVVQEGVDRGEARARGRHRASHDAAAAARRSGRCRRAAASAPRANAGTDLAATPPGSSSPAAAAPAPAPPSSPADIVAELDRLAARHAAGEISAEAFAASKRALLARL